MVTTSNTKIKIFRNKNSINVENAVNEFCNREDVLVHSVDLQTTFVNEQFAPDGRPTAGSFYDTVMVEYQEVKV